MGLAYNTYLNSSKIYGCRNCKAHLSNHEDIISRVCTTWLYLASILHSKLVWKSISDDLLCPSLAIDMTMCYVLESEKIRIYSHGSYEITYITPLVVCHQYHRPPRYRLLTPPPTITPLLAMTIFPKAVERTQ